MDQTVKYFECGCGCEVLRLEYDKDDSMLYLYIYELKKYKGIWQRLRHIWKIIKTGEPYEDQTCFFKKEAIELSELIKDITKG